MDAAQLTQKALDLIDSHNISQAETVVENGLRKFPAHHGLLAAEAFVLLRSQKQELARSKAETLSRLEVSDPTALNALTHVLQQVGSWEALAHTYQRVVGLLPESISALENLFQSLIRLGKFQDAQKIAMQIQKKSNNDPKHQTTVAMAMLAQVPVDSKDHLLLKLSTRILETVITTNGNATTETCKMLVDILAQQERFDDALAFLCGKHGQRIGLLERRLENIRSIFTAKGESHKANAVAKALWRNNSDNWNYFLWYLDGIAFDEKSEVVTCTDTLTLECEPLSPFPLTPDTTVPAAFALISQLQETEMQDRRKKLRRGPFLAQLEVLQRTGDAKGLGDALKRYCELFFSKPTCFMDIVTYMSSTSSIQAVLQWCNEALSTTHSDSSQLAHHFILILKAKVQQLLVSVDEPRPDDEVMSEMSWCVEQYNATNKFSESLAWSEEGLCDGYISVALTLALRQFAATKGKAKRWLADGVQILARTQRKLNNPSWLMLGTLFLQHFELVDLQLLKQLDFKSVQHDSMYRVGCAPLIAGGALDELERWNEEGQKFYGSLGRDTSLLRVKVFKFFTWPVWKDLIAFEAKLSSSIARLETVANFALTNIRCCQTQKYLFAHLEALLGDATQLYQQASFRSNEDSLVVRSVIMDYVHSAAAQTMATALMRPSEQPIELRVANGKGNLFTFALLYDLAMREQARQAKANAPKPKKGEPPLVFSVPSSAVEKFMTIGAPDLTSLPCVLLRPLASLLAAVIMSRDGDEGVSGEKWTAAVDAMVAITAEAVATPATLLNILNPSAYALIGLLQVAPTTLVPISRIAEGIKAKILPQCKAAVEQWYALPNGGNSDLDATCDETSANRSDLVALQQQKLSKLKSLLEEFSNECVAASKRR